MKTRLNQQPDGKPRLYIMRGCTVELDSALLEDKAPQSTEMEVEGYEWETNAAGLKEVPKKLHDHGMDALRYAVMHLERNKPREALTPPRFTRPSIRAGL